MMRDRPRGADLLKEARRVLANIVLPNLASETRFQALLVVRAIDLAEHEFCASPEIERKLNDLLRQIVDTEGTVPELLSVLSEGIRSGGFDASEELYRFLQLIVAFKLKETNPSKVERALEVSLDRMLLDGSPL